MGKIAEMLVNGFMCQVCGMVIDEEEPGYPRTCDDCKKGGSQLHASKKKNKVDRISTAMTILDNAGIDYFTNNEGVHIIVTVPGMTVDLWATKGKFKVRGKDKTYYGMDTLLNLINQKGQGVKC